MALQCRRCESGLPCEFEHGTSGGYGNHGCRCDLCVAAKRAVSRQQYAKIRQRKIRCVRCDRGEPCEFEHGENGYNRHGCRCNVCITVRRSKGRDRQHKRRERHGNQCSRCRDGLPCEFKHGVGGYGMHRCRCEVCVSAQREKTQRWREANREKYNRQACERQRVWREKYPEKSRASARAYVRRHPEKAAAQRADWRSRNKERIAENNRRWGLANREYVRQLNRQWREVQLPRLQAATPRTRHQARWTLEDDAVVLRDDLPLIERAFILGRSYVAVSNRRKRLRET